VLDSIRALMLIRSYRGRGHSRAQLDPLGLQKPSPHSELDPATYGFTAADMDRPSSSTCVGKEHATLREILAICRASYCGSIGVEFMHIQDPDRSRGSSAGSKARPGSAPSTPRPSGPSCRS
jgi:2-oxoglutarate dehydrogenase E1 component